MVRKCKASENGNHRHCEEFKDSRGDTVVVCHDCETTLGRKTEIYSRVVGYLRPTDQWNRGKRAEFEDRKTYKVGFSGSLTKKEREEYETYIDLEYT